MARLHEFEGKAILSQHGLAVPRGGAAPSPAEAEEIARRLGGPVVVKIQAWTTGRAAMGGVAFAQSPAEAGEHARRMLAMTVGQFPVSHVLVEEKLAIARELFVSFSIDDRERAPVMLAALGGGSGIEERSGAVTRIGCSIDGVDEQALAAFLGGAGLGGAGAAVGEAIRTVFAVARACEARSVEINPLVVTASGAVVAADCRMTIDDYAVFRHPELGIDIARELDHPPTALERIAYQVEQEDHRGTFFFAQMHTIAGQAGQAGGAAGVAGSGPGGASRGLIGFHGAGGGGSMMSMDAITAEGFTIANFCDTSGNPSPAKVYRAARIILQQPGLVGYFGSGSGVANQEQFWSAYGLAKAFWELELDIPAVIRLGGNTEDRAVEILEGACRAAGLKARVEGCRKNDAPAKIAARFAALVQEHLAARGAEGACRSPRRPAFVGAAGAMKLAVKGGCVWIDLAAWRAGAGGASVGGAIAARSGGLLRDVAGAPELTVSPEEFFGKDSEMIACEVECRRDGIDGLFVELPIPGL